ncbi:MAG: FKBP-type peptidyl-prolyl cis-trans isomerase [Chitinophagaceae bacterium]|nr:FKBP-type peptidyl-prolyl cis-trans isomerase [Chitinophagaceae bacterium]MCB9046142.1 FKBP-type peptidyl-prolyl cis-trans isomerase [Chitinophagales bacterium]
MTKNQILALAIGAISVGFTSCDKTGGYKKTSDGLLYRIIKDEPGETHPKVNDIVEMHVNIRIGDSTLLNSRQINGNQPFKFPLMEGTFKSDWINGMTLLTAGDSAIFYVPVDSAKKYAQGNFPEFAQSGDTVIYEVQLLSVESAEDVKKKEEEAASKQKENDDAKLQAYFAEKHLTPQKTESGLYYIIDKQGSGPNVEKGQKVTVNYTGTNLEGKPFDSNVDPQFNHVEPFSFDAGVGQVIPGWDEGILLLNKGSKARFFIPSPLAYGPRDMGPDMGANAILVFEVEIRNIEPGDTKPAQ